MGKSCVIFPKTKNGNDSEIFGKLVKLTNDIKKAQNLYLKVISKSFKAKYKDKVRFTKEGEPMWDDLVNVVNINYYNYKNPTKQLNEKYYEEADLKFQDVSNLQSKANSLNFSKEFIDKGFFAEVILVKKDDNQNAALVVKEKKYMSDNAKVYELKHNNSLNKFLMDWLKKNNIGVGYLSKLQERLKLDAITDLDLAKKSGEGLSTIIRLSADGKSEVKLPEEVAHWALEAMEENPIKTRLINQLKNSELLQKIFGDRFKEISTMYNDNLDLMAREALGKLVAEHFNNIHNDIHNKPLFQRLMTRIKDFWKKFNVKEIDDAIESIYNDSEILAKDIYYNNVDFKSTNIKFTQQLASLNDDLDDNKKTLESIIENEIKRYNIYKKRSKSARQQQELIDKLKDAYYKGEYLQGISDYVKNCNSALKSLRGMVYKIKVGDFTLQEKFKALLNLKYFIASYSSILKDIKRTLDEQSEDDVFDSLKENILNQVSRSLGLLSSLGIDFLSISKVEFKKFLTPMIGSLKAKMATDKNTTDDSALDDIYTLNSDISLVDRWMYSMADSPNLMIQMYDSIIKDRKNTARLKTIKDQKRIIDAVQKLENNGINDTEFMYERKEDNSGYSGNLVDKVHWDKYNKAKQVFLEYIDEKYKDLTDDDSLRKKQLECKAWNEANLEVDPIEKKQRPKLSKYANPAYNSIMSNPIKKEFYELILEMKESVDKTMPNPKKFLAPQIRKDFLQRMNQNSNKVRYFWESIKDNFIAREDDTEFGSTLTDFENKEVLSVPIYYTRTLEDMNDLSTDLGSTMIAYMAMANEYNSLNEVVDQLEVGKIMLEDEWRIPDLENGKPKEHKLSGFGLEFSMPAMLAPSNKKAVKKINDLMDMHMYGKKKIKEGPKNSISKTADTANTLTSYFTTALSFLTSVANLVQNKTNLITTGLAGSLGAKTFFSIKDLTEADGIYVANSIPFLSELGSRIKTSKLSLFDELFNVSQTFSYDVKDARLRKKNRLSRTTVSDVAFGLNRIGDHSTQHQVAIALALNVNLKQDGRDTNLWEVLTPVHNPGYSSKLVIPDNVTKADGTKFTDQDIIDFTKKVRAVQDRLFGIYNDEDANAASRYALGRLIFQFKKWMVPLYTARFGGAKWHTELGTTVEGTYVSTYKFIMSMVNDMRNGHFDIIKNWKKLTDFQKSNVVQSLLEMTTFLVLNVLQNLLTSVDDDDDENRPWATRLAMYAALRLKTDMGAMLPSYSMASEAKKLWENPIAATLVFTKLVNLIKLVDPSAIYTEGIYTEDVASGMYKGKTKAEKILLELVPGYSQIYKAWDPDYASRWYK